MDPRLSELGCKSCVLFTHCRQESATFNLIITQPGAHLLEIPCRFANSVILHPPRVIVATDDADALRFPFSLLHIETYADAGTPKLSHLATGSSLPHRLAVRALSRPPPPSFRHALSATAPSGAKARFGFFPRDEREGGSLAWRARPLGGRIIHSDSPLGRSQACFCGWDMRGERAGILLKSLLFNCAVQYPNCKLN